MENFEAFFVIFCPKWFLRFGVILGWILIGFGLVIDIPIEEDYHSNSIGLLFDRSELSFRLRFIIILSAVNYYAVRFQLAF